MSSNSCGLSYWKPQWLQRFANPKSFLIVYGFLGTVQAMSYLYFIITLTTIERRFKIPSQTTGIILSGNELSQILLSLILSYTGGQRNRPLWIGAGVVFQAISCFILAMPHFIYGAGDEALQLTKEYNTHVDLTVLNSTANEIVRSRNFLCLSSRQAEDCDELFSIVPLILIFLSQFVLGIGNTLYYSLGQTYLDDNTKKTNTPMMFAYAMSLRMLGPVIGFVLGPLALEVYIDPTKTPLIDSKDPRWLGAWWLGWIVLGIALFIFAFLISLFPKDMKKKESIKPKEPEKVVASKEEKLLLEVPGMTDEAKNKDPNDMNFENFMGSMAELPSIDDDGFWIALLRLFKNKILMCNIVSTVFYILGASGFMTFMAKYMEIQFHKSSSESTTITGPLTLFGMLIGFLASGYIITKKKPSSSVLLFWNVIVGALYMFGQLANIYLYCPNDNLSIVNREIANLSSSCNLNCDCDKMPYSPVCDPVTWTTYYSPCHAGCDQFNETTRFYSKCQCSKEFQKSTTPPPIGIRPAGNIFNDDFTDEPTIFSTMLEEFETTESSLNSRRRRQTTPLRDNSIMTPGVCTQGCVTVFLLFATVSGIINMFGSSGRITNLLVNYRCVEKRDKAFAQGLFLMMISLFAMIPGPILYGHVIDKTCLVWNFKCNERGNCQIYDQTLFRYYFNMTAMALTSVAVLFDGFVWYFGRHVNFYTENEGNTVAAQQNHRNNNKA